MRIAMFRRYASSRLLQNSHMTLCLLPELFLVFSKLPVELLLVNLFSQHQFVLQYTLVSYVKDISLDFATKQFDLVLFQHFIKLL